MIRCHIRGIGTMSIGLDAPFSEATAMLENLPIREYVNPKVSRRFGRLSKMIYIAASRAIAHAGIADPTAVPIVNATCLGETGASIGLLEQIHQTKGTLISPALVPNSVHNAPAGYLTIGIKNHAPAVTVSQGWLSSEAAVAAASDLLAVDMAEEVLVLSGDEASPNWVSRLDALGAGHLARAVEQEAMQEGAVAVVLGKRLGDPSLGSVTAAVERGNPDAASISRLLKKHGINPSTDADIRLRINASGDALKVAASEVFNRPLDDIPIDGPGPGTVQAAALNALVSTLRNPLSSELLLLAAEVGDIAFLHWRRAPA